MRLSKVKKDIFYWVAILVGIATLTWAADQMVTQLTEDTSPTSDDLLYVVNNPSGTPTDRKVTLQNAIRKAHGFTSGQLSIRAGVMYTSTDNTPDSDDMWQGRRMSGTAGQALNQWDLVYAKNALGTLKWYKYDANGTDKYYAPRGLAMTAAGGDGSSFTVAFGDGVVRNDGWADPGVSGMSNNSAEGKDVYASTTAGAITLTAPSTSGDQVARVGYVLEQNVILFSLGNITLIEVE